MSGTASRQEVAGGLDDHAHGGAGSASPADELFALADGLPQPVEVKDYVRACDWIGRFSTLRRFRSRKTSRHESWLSLYPSWIATSSLVPSSCVPTITNRHGRSGVKRTLK